MARDYSHLREHQWTKGKSGNPKGRPAGRTVWEAIQHKLEEPDPDEPDKSITETLAERFIEMLLDGDMRAWTEALNRLEGKVTDRVSLEDDRHDPLDDIPPDRLKMLHRDLYEELKKEFEEPNGTSAAGSSASGENRGIYP